MFKLWIWKVVLVAAIIQGLFFFSPENIFAITCVISAWWLVDKLILNKETLARYTFSTVIILGYSLTQYCLPLIFTLLEGKPLVYNLKFPYSVFIHSLLALAVFLSMHHLYKIWREGLGSKLYNKMSWILRKNYFFTPPSDFQLWMIGFIGLAGMIITFISVNHYDGTALERGAGAKFLHGLVPYAYAPFFILLKPLLQPNRPQFLKKPFFKVLVFAVVLLFVGMGGNSRGLFMTGITAVGISYLIGLLLGKFDYKIFNLKNFALALVGVWIITGPLAKLGTAMVIVRAQRSNVSSEELIMKTLQTYQDDKAIQRYKSINFIDKYDWDETYFDNIFLARFCNLKYNDASLELAYKIRNTDKEMFNYSVDKFWSTLPAPIISFFRIKIDKLTLNTFSYGDYLYYRAGGQYIPGAFRTGHFAGTGLATFGWWYLLLMGVGVLPLFFLVDLFVVNFRENGYNSTYLSLAGLIEITFFFTLFSVSNFSESVVNIYSFFARGWFQMLLLYWLLLFVTRKLGFLKRFV
ncbi:hypothetical protein [Larkinella terrae]|uniref:hypothetical protein n=1 Tax=Larkinella terrae TaxID=2025311 RepID=UPI00147979A7|nr:hypothetical protein [Larkinella terrae]